MQKKSLKLQIGQCVWDTGIAGPRCTAGSAGAVSDVYQKISLPSEAVTNAPPARPVYYADFAFSDDSGLCDQVFPSRRWEQGIKACRRAADTATASWPPATT